MSDTPHIWNGKPGKKAWCGVGIPEDTPLFSVVQALFAIEEKREVQPCPACAREIIKQLLKAIE